MKINGEGTTYWQRVRGAYQEFRASRSDVGQREGINGAQRQDDSIELSAAAKLAAAMKTQLTEINEARTAKVEALKAAVATGTYSVPLEDVADALLKEMGR